MSTTFIGEHLLPGSVGHFFVITSFVAALFSTFSYFRATRTELTNIKSSASWTLLGRWGFFLHSFAVIGIFIALYYIIENHLFEYHYAWEHSSVAMPGKYLLSCFWEGQQGSFMLWSFWHCVLGIIVMKTAKGLETRTMTIISLVQVCLSTMLLGFYISAEYKIGATPFDLMRHAMQGAPIFTNPNYMETKFMQDGNGLNVLLQNYWMVIHPPVLFLGFATSLIPFAYCIAAIWKGEYQSFVKPTINWTLLNGAVLGTGIMMGGAWAYESLNFGGYWAWDPVENASLVPWLTLMAGLHTLLSYKASGRALVATFVLLMLTHLLVWYATFLTRTGILGNTSVHAFTGDGKSMTYHLLFVIAILLAVVLFVLIRNWKKIPRIKTEEGTFTREFWMFVGSVILFLSSLQIIITTSIPVWSPLAKFFTGNDIAPPNEPMTHYNNIQVWIAVVLGILSGSTLYMKYKTENIKVLLKQLLLPTSVALVMTVFIVWGQKITLGQYVLMLFAASYGMVANIYYGIAIQKTKFKKLGASVAHFGFATVLLGILLSSYNKHVISNNTDGKVINMGKKTIQENQKESMENIVLYLNAPVRMGEYQATYIGDSEVEGKDKRIYYKVKMIRNDSATKNITEEFMLYPDAFINPKGSQGLSANPSTKHYIDRDIFTYINQAPDKSKEKAPTYNSHLLKKEGDTIFVRGGYMIYNGLIKGATDTRYKLGDSDLAVKVSLAVYYADSFVKNIEPAFVMRNYLNQKSLKIDYIEDTNLNMELYTRFSNLIIEGKDKPVAEVAVMQTDTKDEFIVLKAIVFPYINVLWAGVIIMVFGFFISLGNGFEKLKNVAGK